MWFSRCWIGPKKKLLGTVISANCSSSTHQARNLSTVSLGISSSQLCPLTRQISFKINRAPTVNGATRSIGSYTFDTRLKSKRCVKLFVMVLLVSLTKCRVLLLWSRLSSSTCIDSSLYETMTSGSVDWADSSIRSARSSTLLTNLVSLNSPTWRRCTNSFKLMRGLSIDSTESN